MKSELQRKSWPCNDALLRNEVVVPPNDNGFYSDEDLTILIHTRLVDNMKKKHGEEVEKLREEMNNKQQKPKFSTELLKYRKVEEHLVKSKDYGEAHRTKEKADELEAIETQRWMKKRIRDMNRSEQQFKEKKKQELIALEKRLQTGREELKKQRQFQLER